MEKIASTPEEDDAFLEFVRPAWLRSLRAATADESDAELLLDLIECFLRGLRDSHGVGADAVWRALINGYTAAMTEAYLSAHGAKFMRDA